MARVAPDDGLKGRGTLVTGALEDVQEGGISRGRAQEGIVPLDFADGLLWEREPSLLGKTKDAAMETTIVQRHTSSLLVHYSFIGLYKTRL